VIEPPTVYDRLVQLGGRIASGLLLLGAAAFIVVYVAIASERLLYPYELEWMEGGSVAHVQQILDGRRLYHEPNLDFVAFNYMPLYFYVSAAVAAVIGNGFFALRLVSLLASLGCFILIFQIVLRRSASAYASIAAAALFAASFRLTGAWFDIARVDSLFLALLLAGIYLFDSPRAALRSYLSPSVLFLSFFTKQTALFVAVGLAVSALLTRRGRERVMFAAVFGSLVGISTIAMNVATEGWFRYYVFGLAASHDVSQARVTGFWTTDLRDLYVAFVFCFVAILVPRGSSRLGDRTVQDALLFVSLLVASYLVRIHPVAYTNALMPAAAAVAIYFGVGFAEGARRLEHFPAAKLTLVMSAALQFLALVYSPTSQVPSAADRRAGERLVERVSSLPGEVFWAQHPWYLTEVGKPMQAHEMAVVDIVRDRNSTHLREQLQQELAIAVDTERYSAFVLDGPTFALKPPNFDARYVLADSDLTGCRFFPVTGTRRKPTYLFVRRLP
jgi:hypothetical protein